MTTVAGSSPVPGNEPNLPRDELGGMRLVIVFCKEKG